MDENKVLGAYLEIKETEGLERAKVVARSFASLAFSFYSTLKVEGLSDAIATELTKAYLAVWFGASNGPKQ